MVNKKLNLPVHSGRQQPDPDDIRGEQHGKRDREQPGHLRLWTTHGARFGLGRSIQHFQPQNHVRERLQYEILITTCINDMPIVLFSNLLNLLNEVPTAALSCLVGLSRNIAHMYCIGTCA